MPNLERAEIPTPSQSFEELAAQQGVQPVRDFEDLLGSPYPDDESAEEFEKPLRSWRPREQPLNQNGES